MTRALPPLWLAQGSRFAGWPRRRAVGALLLLALLVLATLTTFATPSPPAASHDPAKKATEQADVVLYDTIVEGVRHGGNYYAVAADALRAGNYPLKPFVAFRLPTLAMVEASLPHPAVLVLLYLLAAAVFAAWYVRLKAAMARGTTVVIALALLAGGMMAFVQPALIGFHEIWAGLLIALSLALRQPGRWVESVAIGLAAMLVRETAALFVGVMALAALVEGERREFAGWCAATTIFAAAVALHAHAVAQVIRPLDPTSPGWAGMLGFGFFVKAITVSTALDLAPVWLAAVLVGLTLFGWAAWRDGTGARALGTFALYALLIATAGRVDTFYWALLVAPTILVGLAFVPDGVRDLIAAALDRRRIVVTRVVR